MSKRNCGECAPNVVGGRDWVTVTKNQVEKNTLPAVCIVCGDAASTHVNRTFEWRPAWIDWLSLAGDIPGFVAEEITTSRYRIPCPVCKRHTSHWSRFTWVCGTGWLAALFVAAIGGLVGWLLNPGSVASLVVGATVLGIVGLAIWGVVIARLGVSLVRVTKITRDSITLGRVSWRFAQAVDRESRVPPPLPK